MDLSRLTIKSISHVSMGKNIVNCSHLFHLKQNTKAESLYIRWLTVLQLPKCQN